MESLCKSCIYVREVVSGTGSRFFLYRLSQEDKRFPKYPPQPVVRCNGHEDKRIATTYTLEVLPGTFAIFLDVSLIVGKMLGELLMKTTGEGRLILGDHVLHPVGVDRLEIGEMADDLPC